MIDYKEVWRTAMTLANNICVKVSDRYNADDETEKADAAAECANKIRGWITPTDDQIVEMLEESGAKTTDAPRFFEPFKLVVKAYAVSDYYVGGPSWAEVTVTPKFLHTLKRLRRFCREEVLESVTIQESPDRWDLQDDLRIRDDSMRVFGDSFWFEARPKHADYFVETQMIGIDDLISVAEKIAGNDVESPMPDGFLIRRGVVFYDNSNSEDDLADMYFE